MTLKPDNIGKKPTITSGHISFVPTSQICPFLFPRIFIGISARPETQHLNAGQFLFEHQYAGHSCSNIDLYGVILPIVTAAKPDLVQRLAQFANHYGQNIYNGNAVEAQRMLDAIGPLKLHSPPSREHVEEAFFRFQNTDDVIQWARESGFGYVDRLQEKTLEQATADSQRAHSAIASPSDEEVAEELRKMFGGPGYTEDYRQEMIRIGSGRKTVESHRIRRFYRTNILREHELYTHHIHTRSFIWEGLLDFTAWLRKPSREAISPDNVFSALIYENSD